MLGLSYLYYPWGFLVQIIALVHFVRRRPETYWFYIILFGGFLGAAVYIVAEVIPDAALLRGAFQGFGRRSRIQAIETQILDNPSAGNYEELGELCFEQKEYSRARDGFSKAIALRSDSPYTFYHRAQCSLALDDLGAAIPDLEHVVASDAKFDYYRAAGLLADAYARTGRIKQAEDPVFYDPGDTLQLRALPEAAESPRTGERMGAEAPGEETHSPPVYAADRTAVVPPRQSPGQGSGRQRTARIRPLTAASSMLT